MTFSSFTVDDLPSLSVLQPEGWNDIVPSFEFYTQSPFCYPLKLVDHGDTIGVGCAIVSSDTAWLGHIIVAADRRGKGLGTKITAALVNVVGQTSCETIMLLATKLGEPVYRKVGFVAESTYVFLKGETFLNQETVGLHDYNEKYDEKILSMDRLITGEDRSKILLPHLSNSILCLKGEALLGYYLPGLGDGPIIAIDDRAGRTLMVTRSQRETKFVLPSENEDAIDLLTKHDFELHHQGTRMRLGKPLAWQPKSIFNRIGGNLG